MAIARDPPGSIPNFKWCPQCRRSYHTWEECDYNPKNKGQIRKKEKMEARKQKIAALKKARSDEYKKPKDKDEDIKMFETSAMMSLPTRSSSSFYFDPAQLSEGNQSQTRLANMALPTHRRNVSTSSSRITSDIWLLDTAGQHLHDCFLG